MPSLTDLFVADWKKHGTMAILDGMISHNLYDKEFIEKDPDFAVDTMQALLEQGEDVIKQIYFKEE